MIEAYNQHVAEREAEGLPPLALDTEQTAALVELVKSPPDGQEQFLINLLVERVPAGVDDAAYVKAAFLSAITKGETTSPLIDAARATELLGTMLGGYNIESLIAALNDDVLAPVAVTSEERRVGKECRL